MDPETGVADNHYTFYESWKLYYDAIKEADPTPAVGGPKRRGLWPLASWQHAGVYEILRGKRLLA